MAKITPASRKRNVIWPIIRMGKGWSVASMGKRYESGLKLLYQTPRGSIIWAPDFGVLLHQLRTQSITREQRDYVVEDTKQVTMMWLPDIELLDLSYTREPDSEHLDIEVTWGIPDAGGLGSPFQRSFAHGPVATLITI